MDRLRQRAGVHEQRDVFLGGPAGYADAFHPTRKDDPVCFRRMLKIVSKLCECCPYQQRFRDMDDANSTDGYNEGRRHRSLGGRLPVGYDRDAVR